MWMRKCNQILYGQWWVVVDAFLQIESTGKPDSLIRVPDTLNVNRATMSCRVTTPNSAQSLWTPLSGFSDKVQEHKFLINTLSRHRYWLFDANHARVTENGTAVCWVSYRIVVSRASLKAKADHKYRTRLTSSFNLIRKDWLAGTRDITCHHHCLLFDRQQVQKHVPDFFVSKFVLSL